MTHRTLAAPAAELPPALLAALKLPRLDGLQDEQVRGRACVWCKMSPLTAETAVDLGEHLSSPSDATSPMRWCPRSCRPCVAGRAHKALFVHAPMCEQCVDNVADCEIGLGLNRLLREGRR